MPVVPDVPPAGPEAPPELVWIADDEELRRLRRRHARRMVWATLGLAVLAGIVTASLACAAFGLRVALICGVIALYATPFVVGAVFGRKARRRVVQYRDALRDGAALRDLFRAAVTSGHPGALMVANRSIALAAAAMQQTNRAVVFAAPGSRPEITPFDVPFEARPIDECVIGFDELQAARRTLVPAASMASDPRDTAAPRLLHRVARNAATWGGRRIVVPLAIMALGYTLLTLIWRWPFNFLHGVLAALVALVLLVPQRKTIRRAGDWYVAPGAIIIRFTRPLRDGTTLRFFDRRSSVLVASLFDRSRWFLAVADTKWAVLTSVSPREAEFALRAFLSPLAPPNADQLGDFC